MLPKDPPQKKLGSRRRKIRFFTNFLYFQKIPKDYDSCYQWSPSSCPERSRRWYLFCSFGVEPSPTAEIVSGRILAAPLFLEIVHQKGQYRGFRGYSPNRSIKVWRRGLLSGGVKRESMAWFVHDVPVTSAEVAGRIVNPSPVLISYCALQQVLSAAAPPTKAPVQYM